MTKILITSAILIMHVGISSAASSNKVENVYDNLGLLLLGGLALFVIIAAGITIIKILDAMVRDRQGENQVDLDVAKAESTPASEPLWRSLYRQATKAVPVSREKEILLDHDYDGIKELDNNLPPWWLAMFYVTIVWGVLYFGYYHLTDYGMSSHEAYTAEMAAAAQEVAAFRSTQTVMVDETNVTTMDSEADLAKGKQIYDINCVVCHLDNGAGLVGPNLTDEYWINGGSIQDIFSTIKYGVPEKGMIAWSAQIKPDDMQRVASYVMTLQGTNPPNGKAPEGEKYVPESESTAPTTDEDKEDTETI
ncbi:MAG: c-type cytochrome [Saprospiraceae bacterium]|nr:c-type cytochrome [Saprospiraceae bacterium]